ncbi:MAG TPA: FtsK/SpoIIIE domain-containing protein [Candidatus Lumbricidophila sp.]|nr:FtsK/SpoIIIE domain-containing protein [Candidatus Lumbricidophila sp.]
MVRADLVLPQPRLSLPPSSPQVERSKLPVIASLAPIGIAAVLWPLTGSPLMLAFAALSPVIALATAFEQRRAHRRARARHAQDRTELCERLEQDIDERLRRLRISAWEKTPTARQRLGERVGDTWRATPPTRLVLGAGAVASQLQLDGEPVDERDRQLVERAAVLSDAPVDCPVGGGIGVLGPLPLARAAARALVVQIAAGWAPHQVRFVVPTQPEWEWLERLPHHDGVVCTVRDAAGSSPTPTGAVSSAVPASVTSGATAMPASIEVFVARYRTELPATIATVITVESPGAARVERVGGTDAALRVRPGLVGTAECRAWADEVGADPRSLAAGGGCLRCAVDLASLAAAAASGEAPDRRAQLTVPLGADASAPVCVDLVRGPHALVAGTTGSGKSELLIAWVAALARDFSPTEVSFLLVDFKGGAAFAPLAELPHVLGVVTDLDGSAALRAVESLRSELRRREALLREAGVRDLAELDPTQQCGRLVIVVDEFQALIDRYPDVAQVIADIAARGRSLGVHLILATQRPGGVVREQVTANCGIRICLRVLAAADSVAVVGDDRAAGLPVAAPGRAVVDAGAGEIGVIQTALATPELIAAIAARWRTAPTAHRPWLPALPTSIPMMALAPARRLGTYPFGLLDDPANQAQPIAFWEPTVDHHLLIIGPPRSGRSTVLAALAALSREAVWMLPERDADAWAFLDRLDSDLVEPGLVVIDDLDLRFRNCGDEYRHAALQRIELLMAQAPPGVGFAVAVSRPTALPTGLRDQFGAQVWLRHQSKADLVQAGGDPALWRPNAPVGSGQWAGLALQVADASPMAAPTPDSAPELCLDPQRVSIVVCAPPVAARFELAAAGVPVVRLDEPEAVARLGAQPAAGPMVLLGTAEQWARSWQLLAALRPQADLVVAGSVADLRALTNQRMLPPLLDAGECWVVDAAGGALRRTIPGQSGQLIRRAGSRGDAIRRNP